MGSFLYEAHGQLELERFDSVLKDMTLLLYIQVPPQETKLKGGLSAHYATLPARMPSTEGDLRKTL